MLVINLFGAPGVGKSTYAAGLFYKLKQAKVNTELVTEYAKELTWEDRSIALSCQPAVLGEQYMRLFRLRDSVDVVVTDSPLLLSIYYNAQLPREWLALPDFVIELHYSFQNLNFLLPRDPKRPYNPKGRSQDEAGSDVVGYGIQRMLNVHKIQYTEVPYEADSGKRVDRLNCLCGWVEDELKLLGHEVAITKEA